MNGERWYYIYGWGEFSRREESPSKKAAIVSGEVCERACNMISRQPKLILRHSDHTSI